MLRALAAFVLPFCAAMGVALAAMLVGASAAEPVRQIPVYVQPYYEAARNPGEKPMVLIGKSFDGMLASTRREDIVAARDKVLADPRLVTPMTMMVLAIRLYDVGMRDDSVFWFYAAKDRFITLSDVIDVRASNLAGVEEAVKNFATLAGPFINSYAFCDIGNQRAIRTKALAWVEQNPYEAMFLKQLTAKPGDRQQNLARSLADIKASAAKERAYFDNPSNVAEFAATRKKNDTDSKFCWKS
jgi:hypothetical protein